MVKIEKRELSWFLFALKNQKTYAIKVIASMLTK